MCEEKVKPNPLKAELRADVGARLLAMTEEECDRQSKIILEKILVHPKFKSAKRVALYLSMANEVPTEPLLQNIISRGDQCCQFSYFVARSSYFCDYQLLKKLVGNTGGDAAFVPRYSKGNMRMLRLLDGDLDAMEETTRKIRQHSKDVVREDAIENGGVDLVIAAGRAFTREGWRCGLGGGYYDRYLSGLISRHGADPQNFRKPYVIGICFKEQIYPEIPVDQQDVPVNEVVTAE